MGRKRIHQAWSPGNMADGYINNRGRFMVYFPGHHRGGYDGYVHRACVHYEFYNNTIVPAGYDVHHKNENKLDDSKTNLVLVTHLEHTKLHNKPIIIKRRCLVCGKGFEIRGWREGDKKRGRTCSLSCARKNLSDTTRLKMRLSHLGKIPWNKNLKRKDVL